MIESDIYKNISYLCVDEGKIVGTFVYFEGIEPDYAEIHDGQWLNDEPYGVVHRVASATGKRGVATYCLNWSFEPVSYTHLDVYKRQDYIFIGYC